MPVYLAPYHWNTTDFEPMWRSPYETTSGAIDLRANPQIRGDGIAEGWGLFETRETEAVADQILLPDLDQPLTSALKVTLVQELGLGEAIVANTTRELIEELLIGHADPTREVRWGNLMPTRGRMDIILGRRKILSRRYSRAGSEWMQIRDRLRDDYARIDDDVSAGRLDADRHRKVLGCWGLKYNVDPRQFIARGRPEVKPLRPETTITESFNQADSTTLGPDLTWTETFGDLETFSNRVRDVDQNSTSEARAESDLSDDDMETNIDHYVFSGSAGADQARALARFSASARTFYGAIGAGNNSGSNAQYKTVAGTFNNVGTATQIDTRGSKVTCEVIGSTVRMLVDDAEHGSATDTSISGHVRGGIVARNDGQLDNFSAEDLAVAGNAMPMAMNQYRRRRAG